MPWWRSPRSGAPGRVTPQAKDIELLRSLPLFSTLSPATFARLADSVRFDRYVKGDTIVRQGEKAQWVMVVLEGYVKLTRLSANGEETLIHIFGRGETFAESVAVLGDNHTTTAEATGPTRIVRMPAHVVAQAAREAPELALAILSESSAKIWALMDEIEALKAQTADQRVLRFLLSLCPPGHGAAETRLPYTKGVIAASLGLKQETLSRSFARLKTVGVEIEGRAVRIADVKVIEQEIERLNRLV
ncbi:MAG: Crp/Fnr family transcriptional regulator [Hyphomicrobiales bacterium]|nr:Crp/Fnr family transcriptional regulator [Hyphomicrobiales bacterium]